MNCLSVVSYLQIIGILASTAGLIILDNLVEPTVRSDLLLWRFSSKE